MIRNYFFLLHLFSLVVFVLVFQLTGPACAEYWPQEKWRIASPESQGMSSEVLSAMLESVWENDYEFDSIIVIRNGYVILESYRYSSEAHFKHQIYSCTKSVASALIGIAIDKGYIKSIDQSLFDFFPEKIQTINNRDKLNISLKHILMMATGLQCEDTVAYDFKGLKEMWQVDDWVQYVVDLKLVEAPGSNFVYCNGASSLLTAIIQKTTGQEAFEFARKHLFSPLGVQDIHWKSHNGISIGYSDITMRPLDMARFGYLFLKEGRWGEKQIISQEEIADSTKKQIDNREIYGYGYQWWVMDPEIYAARGAYGQRIFVSKEKDMIVVFASQLEDVRSQVPEQLLCNHILPSVKSDTPLLENQSAKERMGSLVELMKKAQ